MAKKSIVGTTFGNKARPTAEEARQMAGQATGAPKKATPPDTEKRERGRPPAQHNFKKFNTLIDPEQRAKLKYLASMEEVNIYELINEALEDLLTKYGEQDKYKGLLR